MSEPFVERLSRFTPDAGGLDRDALLYAAGRGAARPNRGWIALAAALAVTQVLSLVLLLPRPAPPAGQPALPASVPAPLPTYEPEEPDPGDSPDLWSARRRLLGLEPDELPAPAVTGNLIESGPPLRAFAPPPPSILY